MEYYKFLIRNHARRPLLFMILLAESLLIFLTEQKILKNYPALDLEQLNLTHLLAYLLESSILPLMLLALIFYLAVQQKQDALAKLCLTKGMKRRSFVLIQSAAVLTYLLLDLIFLLAVTAFSWIFLLRRAFPGGDFSLLIQYLSLSWLNYAFYLALIGLLFMLFTSDSLSLLLLSSLFISEKFNLFGLKLEGIWNPLSYAEQFIWADNGRPFLAYLLPGLLLLILAFSILSLVFSRKDLSRWMY